MPKRRRRFRADPVHVSVAPDIHDPEDMNRWNAAKHTVEAMLLNLNETFEVPEGAVTGGDFTSPYRRRSKPKVTLPEVQFNSITEFLNAKDII